MSLLSLPVSTLGVPRIGPRRELKAALESYWSGKSDAASLLESPRVCAPRTGRARSALGVTDIPIERFLALRPGARHQRHGRRDPRDLWLDRRAGVARNLFRDGARQPGGQPRRSLRTMARGAAHGVPALEMTKWFDTNYHYMVPEFTKGQRFTLASTKPVDEYREAKALGYHTRPCCSGR